MSPGNGNPKFKKIQEQLLSLELKSEILWSPKSCEDFASPQRSVQSPNKVFNYYLTFIDCYTSWCIWKFTERFECSFDWSH